MSLKEHTMTPMLKLKLFLWYGAWAGFAIGIALFMLAAFDNNVGFFLAIGQLLAVCYIAVVLGPRP